MNESINILLPGRSTLCRRLLVRAAEAVIKISVNWISFALAGMGGGLRQ
jgi:hypothetical protein